MPVRLHPPPRDVKTPVQTGCGHSARAPALKVGKRWGGAGSSSRLRSSAARAPQAPPRPPQPARGSWRRRGHADRKRPCAAHAPSFPAAASVPAAAAVSSSGVRVPSAAIGAEARPWKACVLAGRGGGFSRPPRGSPHRSRRAGAAVLGLRGTSLTGEDWRPGGGGGRRSGAGRPRAAGSARAAATASACVPLGPCLPVSSLTPGEELQGNLKPFLRGLPVLRGWKTLPSPVSPWARPRVLKSPGCC